MIQPGIRLDPKLIAFFNFGVSFQTWWCLVSPRIFGVLLGFEWWLGHIPSLSERKHPLTVDHSGTWQTSKAKMLYKPQRLPQLIYILYIYIHIKSSWGGINWSGNPPRPLSVYQILIDPSSHIFTATSGWHQLLLATKTSSWFLAHFPLTTPQKSFHLQIPFPALWGVPTGRYEDLRSNVHRTFQWNAEVSPCPALVSIPQMPTHPSGLRK